MHDLDWWLLAQRFIWFCYQMRKNNGHGSWHCTVGGSRYVIYILRRTRCKPASLPSGPDRGPGRVWRWGNLPGTIPKPPVAQGAGGIYASLLTARAQPMLLCRLSHAPLMVASLSGGVRSMAAIVGQVSIRSRSSCGTELA